MAEEDPMTLSNRIRGGAFLSYRSARYTGIVRLEMYLSHKEPLTPEEVGRLRNVHRDLPSLATSAVMYSWRMSQSLLPG